MCVNMYCGLIRDPLNHAAAFYVCPSDLSTEASGETQQPLFLFMRFSPITADKLSK